MPARRLLPLVVLAVAAGCSDSSASARDGTGLPTEPEPAADLQSSVCRAYAADLAAVRVALARAPNDPVLREQASAFRAIIADACN